MTNPIRRIVGRYLRDKAVVEQAAKDVRAPDTVVDGHPTTQSPTTATGLPVEGQVRKQWNPRKGGLPTFYPALKKTIGRS